MKCHQDCWSGEGCFMVHISNWAIPQSPASPQQSVMLKRRPCRLQTADRADCADWVFFFYLYINFCIKIFTIVSCFLSLYMCTVTSKRLRTDQRRLRNDRWRSDLWAKRLVTSPPYVHWCVPARVISRKWENHVLIFTSRCKSSFACF